jgi:hypothetical protein
MAKQINYLMIAYALTGDSTVTFYPTPESAKQAFNNHTEPLVALCLENYYDTEEQDVFYHVNDGKGLRFNSGELEALDEIIGESNVYYEWGTVEVGDDVTHYFADFSEWVDDSIVLFLSKEEAENRYESAITEGIEVAKDHFRIIINREEDTDAFSETKHPTENHTDAFFGFDDVYYTARLGEIKLGAE